MCKLVFLIGAHSMQQMSFVWKLINAILFKKKSSNRNQMLLLRYSHWWLIIRFITSFPYCAKTDTFDRTKRNGQRGKTRRKIKLFTRGRHQPRRWHSRWTFGAGIIKVDVLRAEILTDAGSSKDEFWSFEFDVKSQRISIPADRAVEPLPFISDSLIEERIDRLLGH